MNRTIKFRVFCKKHKQWEYYTLGDLVCGSTTPSNGEGGEFNSDTWQQFTGLHDKNGNEIYEGDIIHEHIGGIIVDKRIIKYHNGSFLAVSTASLKDQTYGSMHEKFQYLSYFISNELDIKVIGNIHDNPELLTNKTK